MLYLDSSATWIFEFHIDRKLDSAQVYIMNRNPGLRLKLRRKPLEFQEVAGTEIDGSCRSRSDQQVTTLDHGVSFLSTSALSPSSAWRNPSPSLYAFAKAD